MATRGPYYTIVNILPLQSILTEVWSPFFLIRSREKNCTTGHNKLIIIDNLPIDINYVDKTAKTTLFQHREHRTQSLCLLFQMSLSKCIRQIC